MLQCITVWFNTCLTLTFGFKIIPEIWNLLLIYNPKTIIVPSLNILSQKLKEEFVLLVQISWQIISFMTLTFDSKAISVIWNIPCNVHPMGNNCAKYEHPKSKVKGD